eukprot:TRINITY_DN315_c0_g3_i1.p3 TRINITY_DN315_c0_g3~~TRINITY_DN315_c0_g3_i1.p3  ORF type:complete len:213 (-),score=51.74 TRINITY_DN315_c0_g3_i1:1997-2635(-)
MIGLGGVYDIGSHYVFEWKRGVENLSTMKPAMGGPSLFDSLSPTILISNKGHRLPSQPSASLSSSSSSFGSTRQMSEDRNFSLSHSTSSCETYSTPSSEDKPKEKGEPVGNFPPIFLVHGEADKTVPWASSYEFHKSLTTAQHYSVFLLLRLPITHSGLIIDMMNQRAKHHRLLVDQLVRLMTNGSDQSHDHETMTKQIISSTDQLTWRVFT